MATEKEKTRARRALQEIGKYYGLNKNSILEGTSGAPGSDATPSHDAVSTNTVVNTLLQTKGETLPTIEALLAHTSEDGKKAKMVITPFQAASAVAKPFLNEGFKKPAYQGYGQGSTSKKYSIEQDVMPSEVRKENAKKDVKKKIHVIQMFDPKLSYKDRNAELSSLLLNGIPTIEWSRCVPYFEVVIMSPTANSDEDGVKKQTLAFSFLKDQPGPNPDIKGQISQALYNIELDDKGEPRKSPEAIASVMDVFTMPQTMVNTNNYTEKIKKGYNPFAPFMSVDGFSTTQSGFINDGAQTLPGQGAALNTAQSLRVRLHDKRRLEDVSMLVKPDSSGGYGGTKIAVTFGWSHPDGRKYGRSSSADPGPLFGDVLDASRQTQVFNVTNSRVTFLDGNEAQLDIDLQPAGTKSVFIDNKIASAQTDSTLEVGKAIESLVDFHSFSGATVSKKLSTKSFIKNLKKGGGGPPGLKKDLDEFKKQIGKSKNKSYKDLSAIFKKVFTDESYVEFEEIALKSNPVSTTEDLLREVCRGVDPFLRPVFANNPRSNKMRSLKLEAFEKYKNKDSSDMPKINNWVSFGKVLTFFLSKALTTIDVSETQIVFYPFNHSAGAIYDYNIAQFPISTNELIKDVREFVKANGNVPINQFIKFLINEYLKDETFSKSECFGLVGAKKSADRLKRLNKIYGREGAISSPRLSRPSIRIETSMHMARDTFSEKQNEKSGTNSTGKILRIEIFDAQMTANPFLAELEDLKGIGAIQKLVRSSKTEDQNMGVTNQYRPNHQKLFNSQMQVFEKKLVSASDTTIDKLHKNINDGIKEKNKERKKKNKLKEVSKSDIKKLFDEYVVLDIGNAPGRDVATLKQFLRNESKALCQGIIIHGIEGTSISDMTVQTSEDSDLSNILLEDTRTEEQKAAQSDKGIERVPFIAKPTEIDVTCLGNPFLSNGQEYYVDLGTDTTLDSMYTLTELTHDIEPGKFESKFKLTPIAGGAVYVDAENQLQAMIASMLVNEK